MKVKCAICSMTSQRHLFDITFAAYLLVPVSVVLNIEKERQLFCSFTFFIIFCLLSTFYCIIILRDLPEHCFFLIVFVTPFPSLSFRLCLSLLQGKAWSEMVPVPCLHLCIYTR